MRYVILVSHGQFAEGIKSSLDMFAGDATQRCFALCLHNGESADDFGKKVTEFLQEKQFTKDDDFVVLADIIGGSPLTTFLDLFAAQGYLENSVVLGGVNFSMALTAVVSLDVMRREQLVEAALREGQKAMKQYEVSSSVAEDDI
ncbi:PTS sugar transporter subunit IIA [Lactobacillus sp. XV13L]|nr:PTS sugar transporter subunit IIA [Lactobacillus sp. XV13L]